MDPKNTKALLQKLNPVMARAMEAAAGACIQRTHFEISVEHVLLKLLDHRKGDVVQIFDGLEIGEDDVRAALEGELAKLKQGNHARPKISPLLLEALNQAWNFGSLELGASKLRSGHLLVALLRDTSWLGTQTVPGLSQLDENVLVGDFEALTANSEEVERIRRPKPAQAGEEGSPAPILDEFTTDIVAEAAAGHIDPVVGRDHEIFQVIDILTRRRKNNPILVGEPGVGKSAIVEGMAKLVHEGKVPPRLTGVQIRALDLGQLKAGASMKGEFEERLKSVITAVTESPIPIILFIDEAHTLIGAGGQAGSGDAANLLKPALARGQLRTIAATTWSEYKKYIEKDPALERRFQLVKVDEPDANRASMMLRGLRDKYQDHHKVDILDSALVAAAELSARYITGRQLPDKAIDLLDTACARVKLSLESPPYELTRLQNHKAALQVERESKVLEGELVGKSPDLTALDASLAENDQALEAMESKWQAEKALVEKILALDERLATADESQAGAIKEERRQVQAEYEALAGEHPLVSYRVTADVIGDIVGQWTGIPVGRMVKNELDNILNLEDHLKKRVLGQDHVATRISKAVKASKAQINNPDSPIGVFLAVGPSGTGKTEMALSIADRLFGGERFLIQINMSEYQEKHTVSRLIGSPPGYVGYGEGGVLSEAVRQRPYAVVLLDEVEKGHPDVMNLFYQVFDKGYLADGEGRHIDFRNTIIIMTSNLGSQVIEEMCESDEKPEVDNLLEAIRPVLNQYFKPALLARMSVLPYYPISEAVMKRIAALKLHKVVKRLASEHHITTQITPAVLQMITDRCRLVEAGARQIDHILNAELLPAIAHDLLNKIREDQETKQLTIDAADNRFQLEFT